MTAGGDGDGMLDPGEPSTLTDAGGDYTLDGLEPGATTRVWFTVPRWPDG